MEDSQQTIHEELVQAILRRLEKDLGDLRNLSDIRARFIPRQAIIGIINQQSVMRLLQRLWKDSNEGNSRLIDAARFISPQPRSCRCRKENCTGARMILAILLLISRGDLIATLFRDKELGICDRELPFDTKFLSRRRDSQDDHDQSNQSPARSPTQTKIADSRLDVVIWECLNPLERDLFCYWQWQVITPYLAPLDSEEAQLEVHDEISLPWQELARTRKPVEGEFSFVQKIKIFDGNHCLVSRHQELRSSFPFPTWSIRLMPITDTTCRSRLCSENFRRSHDCRINRREV